MTGVFTHIPNQVFNFSTLTFSHIDLLPPCFDSPYGSNYMATIFRLKIRMPHLEKNTRKKWIKVKSNFSGNLKKLFVLKVSLKDVFENALRCLA